jgi:hypothetical protein
MAATSFAEVAWKRNDEIARLREGLGRIGAALEDWASKGVLLRADAWEVHVAEAHFWALVGGIFAEVSR